MDKTPNKIAYRFLPRRPLDLISSSFLPDTYVARADIAEAILFVLANQKSQYDKKHQPFFLKVSNWTMLKFHKSYSIPSSLGITKKLT